MYWPKDKKFYSGAVMSYKPGAKKPYRYVGWHRL